MIRLQGKDWQEARQTHNFKMRWFEITAEGNIKVVVATSYYSKHFSHYLTDAEKEKFLQSDYYKNSYRHDVSKKHRNVWYNHKYYPEHENVQNWQNQ